MRVKINSPNIAILTPSDHHIVSDGDQGIHTVRVPGELVRGEPVLVLAENRRFQQIQSLILDLFRAVSKSLVRIVQTPTIARI